MPGGEGSTKAERMSRAMGKPGQQTSSECGSSRHASSRDGQKMARASERGSARDLLDSGESAPSTKPGVDGSPNTPRTQRMVVLKGILSSSVRAGREVYLVYSGMQVPPLPPLTIATLVLLPSPPPPSVSHPAHLSGGAPFFPAQASVEAPLLMKALKSSAAFRRDTIQNVSDICSTIQDTSVLTDLGRMTSAASTLPLPHPAPPRPTLSCAPNLSHPRSVECTNPLMSLTLTGLQPTPGGDTCSAPASSSGSRLVSE